MCGIAGGVALAPNARPDTARIEAMARHLCHRGPDGEGVWQSPSGRACLAHRRLSIIDLATGQQPMRSASDRFGLTFNGEIYNYVELRVELERQGVPFATTSDTEVLLRLLERSGAECVHELRGMFAFAAWDDARGVLVLARDRVGKKPLYYVIEDGCLYFASTLEALRNAGAGGWPFDAESIDAYLNLGYIPAPRTAYEGVFKLPAGTVAIATVGSSRLVVRDYWDVAADEPFAGTENEALDRVDELLQTAVAIRLRSDVPLGVFLSGGVDSSLVSALAARHSPYRLKTFSIGFDVAEYDEAPHAARIAKHIGADHHEFRASPDLLHLLPQVVRHFGEPFADAAALPLWALAQQTRRHVTVVLGGDGGDEGFGGYTWYRTAAQFSAVMRYVPRPVALAGSLAVALARAPFAAAPSRLQQLQRAADLCTVAEADRFAALRTFAGAAEAGLLYSGALADLRQGAGAETSRQLAAFHRAARGDRLRKMRFVDIKSYLADCLNPKVDIATMAHGLEARAPLLDQELLRFALTLPNRWLIGRDGGKRLLKRLLLRYYPEELFRRPKQGFTVPLATWFAGNHRAAVESLAESPALLDTGWLRPEGIRQLTREHVSGHRDHSQRLYNLLVLQEWLRRH